MPTCSARRSATGVRLADTDLIIEVEQDFTTYGEEVKFGGGKVIRDGMGQSPAVARRGRRRYRHHQRADPRPLGHRQGRCRAAAAAASPASARPAIPTPAGRRHRRSAPAPRRSPARARSSPPAASTATSISSARSRSRRRCCRGVTTMLGGGTGPAAGTNATTCTPGPWHLARMLQAAEALPMNLGFVGKGNASQPAGLVEQVEAGACRPQAARGLGHHPGGDRLLPGGRRRARRAGGDPHRHAERVGASSRTRSRPSRAAPSTPSTPRAPAAATRPTSSRCAALPNVLPSSTNPTRPYTVNTIDEHLDMLMVCHHLDPQHPGGRRLRRKPHPARDDRRGGHPARSRRVHHDVVRQPGDGPGRRGADPHLADRPQDEGPARAACRRRQRRNDNFRVQSATSPNTRSTPRSRTASPSMSARSRSASSPTSCCGARLFRREARPGAERRHDRRRADGRSQRLDPDAAAGALPADVRRLSAGRLQASSVTFVSRAAIEAGLPRALGLGSAWSPVANTRGGIDKSRMVHNDATPMIEVDPETYEVRADGELPDLRAGHRAAAWRSGTSCFELSQ